MTICQVRQETDWCEQLAHQIEETAEQVIPVLEEVTGLSVGPSPLIRLVNPTVWADDHAAQAARFLARDIADFPSTPEVIETLTTRAQEKDAEMRRIWPLVAGATIDNADGIPQVLIMPEALHHLGFEEPEIYKLLAHELCHVAQIIVGDGALLLAYHTKARAERGLSDVVPAYLGSGHSRWADLQVTTRLLGREVSEHTGRQSERVRQLIHDARARHEADPTRTPGPSKAAYQDGARWVAAVVAQTGSTDLINRAWKDMTLLPTMPEIGDPPAWVRRAAGEPAA